MDFTDALINEFGNSLTESISQDQFNMIQPGDIIIVRYFEVNSHRESKREPHPMLVVHKSQNEVYGFGFDHEDNNPNFSIFKVQVQDWQNAGLRQQSWINLTTQRNVKPAFIGAKSDKDNPVKGHLSTRDLESLIERIKLISIVKAYNLNYSIVKTELNLKNIK